MREVLGARKQCGERCAFKRIGTMLFAGVWVLAAQVAFAQQAEEQPSPKAVGVQITFLPPPVEGTISLGIFTAAGKLIRTLHRDATQKDFVVGLNGFITRWDGRDDAGKPVPAGKYSVRGYAVAHFDIEGVSMLGNEWIADADSPRVRTVISVYPREHGFILVADLVGETGPKAFHCSADGKIGDEVPFGSAATDQPLSEPTGQLSQGALTWMEIKEGTVILAEGSSRRSLPLAGLVKPIAACPGKNGAWVVDDRGDGVVEVKEFSLEGEFKRRLAIDPGEPQPRDIAAVPGRDAILLIEEKPGVQRVRGLALETPAPAEAANDERVSTWKVFLSKTLHVTDSFASAVPHLGRAKPFVPEEKIQLRLTPNPLFKDALGDVTIEVAHDETGSFFRTIDGLPLARISETPHLKWVVMGREGGRVITVFQSDGAVVEEFKARKLAGMMAFDAGEYEWSGR